MTRRTYLLALVSLVGITYALHSQTWLTLNMSPKGKNVELAAFDGFALLPWLSVAITCVALAGLMALYLKVRTRRILLAVNAMAASSMAVFGAFDVFSRSTSAVTTEIDAAVNIASAHDIDPSEIVYSWTLSSSGWATLVLIAALFGLAIAKSDKWPERTNIERNLGKKTRGYNADPISLWESQR